MGLSFAKLAGGGSRPARALRLGAALAAFSSGLAGAQTPAPLANWQYSVGDLLAPLMGTPPEWQAYVGAGATLQPRFEGAKRYHVLPAPIIDVHYRDLAFFSDGEGIGFNLLRGKLYRAGIALTYDLGRDEHADRHLHGLGNIGAAPETKLYADFAMLPVIFDFDLRRAIGGHDGFIGDIGAHVPVPLASNVFLFAGPTVTFADSRYLQSYFGVTPAQSARSGLPVFNASAGLKRAGLGLTGIYQMSRNWMFVSDAAGQQLLGAAGRSPVTQTRAEFSIDANLIYKF